MFKYLHHAFETFKNTLVTDLSYEQSVCEDCHNVRSEYNINSSNSNDIENPFEHDNYHQTKTQQKIELNNDDGKHR